MIFFKTFLLIFFLNNIFSKNIGSFLIMKNKGINIYTPKSPNQILYNNILSKDTEYLVSVVGPAGTGKTFLACIKAIEKLKTVSTKIVI